MKLLLSIGHGGGDGGAVYNGTSEHREAQAVAQQALRLVEPFLSVQIVPDGTLAQRIKWINQQSAELVVELHLNSGVGASGAEVYYIDGTSAKTPATQFSKVYSEATGLKDRGAKPDTATRHKRLGILRDTRPLAFLIELGFIQTDLGTIRTMGAIGVAKACLDFFKIPMPSEKLSEWEKQALEWAKEAIGFNQDNPRDPMTRVETAEALRKFFIFLKNEAWKQ
jgi:hypothetical protein